MQVLKIVIGVIIGFAVLTTSVESLSTERGAGLGGALIGCVLIGALAFWLIKSGIRGLNK